MFKNQKEVLKELLSVINKYDKCEGVGYIIKPILLKLADEVGLCGYKEVIELWNESHFIRDLEKIGKNDGLFIQWDGPALYKKEGATYIGIKQTVDNIKTILKYNEKKKN